MSLCGLRPKHRRRRDPKGKGKEGELGSSNPGCEEVVTKHYEKDRDNFRSGGWDSDFRWARDDQLSVILELLDESSRRNTPNSSSSLNAPNAPNNWGKPRTSGFRRTRFRGKDNIAENSTEIMSYQSSSPVPKPIQAPPRDVGLRKRDVEVVDLNPANPNQLESISRTDASLVFEHFTANDAWELGCALRDRLIPIPTPVVIDISLANQNQTLFHTCTHSGVMPDNENWVARKRKTVLRWGCSTWYMSCKFGGDEIAFSQKYGLGNSAGEYAIHGGGVPIRVTGVEGVVAVVVVSGLKQDEDHAVIVEVIREMYY